MDKIKEVLMTNHESKAWEILLMVGLTSLVFFLIGWMLFGWVISPVEWVPPEGMNGLEYQTKGTYVLLLSEWYAYSENAAKLQYFASQLNDVDTVACAVANSSTDLAEKARLITIAYARNGYGCVYPER